jgi:hypothetical protein
LEETPKMFTPELDRAVFYSSHCPLVMHMYFTCFDEG